MKKHFVLTSLMGIFTDALSVMDEEASPLGLTISWTKTKVQSLSHFLPKPDPLVLPNGQQIKAVEEFIYLGSKFTPDCSTSPEISRRIQLARSAFGRLSRVWRSAHIRAGTKLRLLNSFVLPVLLYGCESWTVSASDSRRLDVFHRNCLRNILGIRWYHFLTTEEVYARAGDPERVTSIIRRRALQLVGHVARLDDNVPAKKLLFASARPPPAGWRRPRGRPKLSWVSQVAAVRPLPLLLQTAQDRRAYRGFIATITNSGPAPQ